MSSRTLPAGKHFMQGGHACAEGAIAAGCRFFAGYPITPSTEIAEHLAQRLPEVGGTFIQMEDEIASMAAIIGASAAGVRSMTATSGPGFSLMMENIGLAIMLEMPCVVVDVQRGSPSTGLPTLTAQADVMQARWGSHGDHEIVAYSPWSSQEMFDLTVHAFNVADRYRLPVIVLADEVVSHMVERVVIPAAEEIPNWQRKRPLRPPGNGFEPFRSENSDLIPPIVHAGEGYRLHYTGLTHDEQGYPDISAEAHHRLVSRLVGKVRQNAAQLICTEEYFLEDARIVVISYGCTARSARRAVSEARKAGIPAGLLRLVSLWPFPAGLIRQLAQQADVFIVSELNLGQMICEVERFVSQPIVGVNHAGGKMISPEPILQAIQEVVTYGPSLVHR